MMLEDMQDAIAAKTKPPRDTYFDKYLALMAHASE